MAATLPGPPQVVNLEPTNLADIFDDIRRVSQWCDVPERADEVITKLSVRVESVRERTSHIAHRPRCFLMEWVIRHSVPGIGDRSWLRSRVDTIR